MLLVLGVLLGLGLALPYRCLDSDVAIFGLMGNDLLRGGHLPSLMYGQQYFFSVTPYVCAALRWLLPGLGPAPTMASAAILLSGAGLWLVYESFLLVEGKSLRWAGWLFCLLLLSCPEYLFIVLVPDGMEVSLLLLGGALWCVARIDADERASWRWLSLLGLIGGLALISRPNVLFYPAVAVAGWLLTRPPAWRKRGLLCLLAGALVGYLPMLLHQLTRASSWPWNPYMDPQPGLTLHASLHSFKLSWHVMTVEIPARLYGEGPLIGPWVALGLLGFSWALLKGRTRAVDRAWALGSLVLLAVMLTFRDLSTGFMCSRYCAHIVLGSVWLFTRFGPRRGGWAALTLLFAAALALGAGPRWEKLLRDQTQRNADILALEQVTLPFLERRGAPVLADYWDAYRLRFLSDGRAPIEAFPWCLIRTYGALSRAELERRALWMVRPADARLVLARLHGRVGPEAMKRLRRTPLPAPSLAEGYELWELEDGRAALELMSLDCPAYYLAPYPPGSR